MITDRNRKFFFLSDILFLIALLAECYFFYKCRLGCVKLLWVSFTIPLNFFRDGGCLFIISQSNLSSYLWDVVLIAAAGILSVKAFDIRTREELS